MNAPIIVTAVVERETRSNISRRGGMATSTVWVAYLSDGRRKVTATRTALRVWLAENGIEVQS